MILFRPCELYHQRTRFCVMREGRGTTLLSQVRERGETWAGGVAGGGGGGMGQVASENLGWCDATAHCAILGKPISPNLSL